MRPAPTIKLVPQPAELTTPRVRRTPTRRIAAEPQELGVVGQVREALRRENRLASACGFLLGGFVPLATYCVAHGEYDRAAPWYAQVATPLVLGGLAYSAKTVYDWGRTAFGLPLKAFGFVVLLEGVMTLSTTGWLGLAALAYLVVINGVATATRLAGER